MKSIYLPLIIFILLFAACKKNGVNPNPANSNGNKGGNTGGGGDSLSVSGFSPLYPYTTDVVTITGTGFNPDKTKDTVIVYYPGNGIGLPADMATINSATATQLKIVIPADSVLQVPKFDFPAYVFEIHANGKILNIPLNKTPIFKPMLHLWGVRGGEYDVSGRPGDTILLSGVGFTAHGNSASIGGQTVNIYKVDTALGEFLDNSQRFNAFSTATTSAYAVIPRTFFGQVNDETATQTKTVSFTNSDGKVSQIQAKFGSSPIMKVNNIYLEGANFAPGYGYSYSLSGLNSNGGKIKVHIIGKYLKNNADIEFIGTDF
ncbi:MAG TPA: hypothetical protein VFE54_03745, partial [Mucilaginibacter sp.]|nr:hypothetical protein [Mucilaginibacter sp.]